MSSPTSAHTARLAEFVTETPATAIDSKVRERALTPIADTIGVMLAGRTSEAGQGLSHYYFGHPQSSHPPQGAWAAGFPRGAMPEVAAYLNATFAHSLDFDDAVPGAGHPSGLVLSAVLAATDPAAGATKPLSGADLVDAYVMGFEVTVRMSRAIGLAHYNHGWHTTSTAGCFGATAGAARALGLSAEETAVAVGIAASMSSGLLRNFGTAAKPFHSGLAARAGYMAAKLAQVGFTASPDILDGPRSYLAVYGRDEEDPAALDFLGAPWALVDPGTALKKYPCCYATHRAIDAALQLHQEHGIAVDDIESVACSTPKGATAYLLDERPSTGLQGKFSMQYVLASAFADGHVGLETFTDEAVTRPETSDLIDRISVSEEAWCRPEDPEGRKSSPGAGGFIQVDVRLQNGDEVSSRVHEPEGSPSSPLAWPAVRAKFVDCAAAGRIDAADADQAFSRLQHLEEQDDVHDVLRQLVPDTDD